MISWLVVFLLTAVVDWLWTFCVQATENKQANRASIGSVALLLCSSLATIAFVEDHWLLIPASLGALVGTQIAVRWRLN